MTPGHLRPVDEVTAPDVQQLGDAVLIQGDALRALYIALHRAIRATSAAGHSPARLQAIQQQIHRALTTQMSDHGHPVAKSFDAQSESNCQGAAELMSVAEAAAELGVSERQMRRLAHDLGQRVGASWAFNRIAVLALARAREKDTK